MPLASDSDFAEIAVPSRPGTDQNRHFISTGTGIETTQAAGNEICIVTTDVMNTDFPIDALRFRWTAWRYLRRR